MAGKPAAPLLRQAIERAGAQRPLVIGDRLDTDIAGGHAVDADSLLVLTGVSTAADVLGAPPEQRPTYLGRRPAGPRRGPRRHPRARRRHRRLDGEPRGTALVVLASGADDDTAGALRALCRVAWDAPAGETPRSAPPTTAPRR